MWDGPKDFLGILIAYTSEGTSTDKNRKNPKNPFLGFSKSGCPRGKSKKRNYKI